MKVPSQQFAEKLKGLERKIKFIKYQYIDMQGNIREVTLTRSEVKGDGRTSVDGSSVFGKIIPPTESDMILIPDSKTLYPVPWEDDEARVLCNMFYPPEKEGEAPRPFEGCPRSILSSLENRLEEIMEPVARKKFGKNAIITKYHAHFAPEVEFLLLKKDYPLEKICEDSDIANNHYFIPPADKANKALKEMVDCLGKMGITNEKYHTEVTTYQYEIGIGHGNVLRIADATMTLKWIIEKVAERYGLRASFAPKFKENVNGSGMHVHQNLAVTIEEANADGNKNNQIHIKEYNLFFDEKEKDGLSDIGRQYIAGLLKYAREITAITNPLPVSYKRLVPGCEAPTYIAWDWENRTALCRGHSPGTNKIRVEYRSPDPTCNPYLAFAAMLSAGLSGIVEKLSLPDADKRDFYHDNKGVRELPGNLREALEEMNKSKMLRKYLGNFLIDNIYILGIELWKNYSKKISKHDLVGL
ncbi:MAG: glutamine synthetase family protein [Candidatus Woesearchaeota archaeon]|nr:glutamine synthetase family protein [Candidatus Woesearchaeota archaeon]